MHSVLYILADCKDRHMISDGWFLATTRNQFFSGWVFSCVVNLVYHCTGTVSLVYHCTGTVSLVYHCTGTTQYYYSYYNFLDVYMLYMCVCLHAKLYGMSDFLINSIARHAMDDIRLQLAWSCGQGYSTQHATIKMIAIQSVHGLLHVFSTMYYFVACSFL